ncbi:MAG: hypothetical protein FJW40_05805 [Acidobacteria bacterium]|nr:hypothetical protein [Acidobacteriota bacterium]
MASKQPEPEKNALADVGAWAPPVAVGWLVPGGGHLMLKRPLRAAMLGGAVAITFLLGLLMRGAFFVPQEGDLLTVVIHRGGYIADMCSGLLYFLATWLGYDQPDVAGHVHDYGTKFLAAAGLMNVLAMVDAFEIATGQKD